MAYIPVKIGGGQTIPLGDVENFTAVTDHETVKLTWEDPDDIEIGGTKYAEWSGTRIVRKVGSIPASRTDGLTIVDSRTRDQYKTTAFVDEDVEYGVTYYYRAFPYTTKKVYTAGSYVPATPSLGVCEIPTVKSNLIYDGTEKTQDFNNYDSDKMSVTGDTGTTAGEYTATFTLVRGYAWSDGTASPKDVTWNIAKAKLTPPTVSSSLVYNATEQTASVSSYDSTKISVTGITGTDAGTYTAIKHLIDSDNYQWIDDTTADKTEDWTISQAAGGATVTVNGASFDPSSNTLELDADNLTATISVTNATGTIGSVTSSDTDVATVTGASGSYTVSSVDETSGSATITIPIAESTNYEAATIEISVKCKFTGIWGAEWDGTSTTAWSRTDDAAGFTDPVPYVNGATNYGSPFDEIQPWAGMVKSERTGGTMVAIPKFWYKITQNGAGMKVQISDGEQDGFSVSPAHMDRGDGKGERDVIYVARYHCGSSAFKSITGQTPKNNTTRANFRTSIHNLGSNIWQLDFATRFTIWLLYIVEFADWNSQAKIGNGCGNNSGVQAMGYTDSMPYHTGTTQSSRTTYGLGTQYRNIEGLWDNVYDWIDGCYNSSTGLNIILDPSKFSDSANGVSVGTPSNGYPSAFTVKDVANTFECFIPTAASGSETTYSCDGWYFGASGPCVCGGGDYSQGGGRGLFCVSGYGASGANASLGSRLMELP